ncbi:hypothetical protein [Aquabacter spiritensis]|uniref:Uncharacterized protein n=1 Tax=Aquabacter spiritensis TaxID=933073 RepID=A0A4R3M0Y8_9HYPH|nr:hypothetical protein [Aquabacter spiritensis]TCT06652.1 hypothetical protein EDC64_102131 [Aquabacter spiritensis]
MPSSKFRLGSRVLLNRSAAYRSAATEFEIVGLMPTEHGECRYRLRSSQEAFERVAEESQIEAVTSTANES